MPSQYRFDDVEIDLTAYRVLKAGRILSIEPKTFNVLLFLVRNPGRLVEKRELLDAVWNDAFVTENVLTRAIAQLRKALGDGARESRYIETAPTQGYRFIAEVCESSTDPVSGQNYPVVPVPRPPSAIWLALGAIVLLAVAITAWGLRPKPAEGPMSAPMPLTTYQGTQLEPSFSPDGNQVAFMWDGEKQGYFEIYIKALGSETPLRLTNDPADDICPKWSPDGRTIAFTRVKGRGEFELVLIPALGGPERILASLVFPVARLERFVNPTWSANGKWLVVPSVAPGGSDLRLFKISVETGEATQITQAAPTLEDSAPEISPDGRTLIFSRKRIFDFGELYGLALDVNTDPVGQAYRIPSGHLIFGCATWNANGSEILLDAVDGVYRVPASGSDTPERITWMGPEVGSLALSRSGNRLAYSVIRGDANIWRIDLMARPTRPERLIASTFRDVYPQYSPDGKRIAFYSDRNGDQNIWMADANGGQQHQLTFVQTGIAGTPHWSPDGKTLALDSNVTGVYQVYTMSPEGGKMTQLTQGPSSNFATTWSRDGRWIYFSSNRTGRNEVWKMPSSGGPPVQMTHGGGVKALESFDGRTIYFSKDGALASLWQMPAEGGQETQLAASLFRFNFATAKQGIYYMTAPGEDGTSTLKFYSFAGGNITTIAPMGNPEFGLDVSPDGRYLIYAQLDSPGSNLMLVENFR